MITSAGHAQSLSAGDVVFTGFDRDGDFAIVALANIPVNTIIYFTNSEWNGTSFESGGGDIKWLTGSSVITAGTVVTFTDINSASERVSTGSIQTGDVDLKIRGETIFAYTGTKRAPETFLAAISTSGNQYTKSAAPDSLGTLKGSGLNEGSTAILLSNNIKAVEYSGERSGYTKKEFLDLLNITGEDTVTVNNWKPVEQSGNQSPFNDTNFTIADPSNSASDTSSATITEGYTPAIVINEIHTGPDSKRGDADGSGTINSGDEFLELVNITSSDLDISGWKIFKDTKLKHTFPNGTIISASGALVLFSDNRFSPRGTFGAAVVQRMARGSSLSLAEGEKTIVIQDSNGNEVLNVTYPDAGNAQSITLDPELNTDFNYSNHATVSGSGRDLFSPGTRVNGRTFGDGTYTIGIRGNEGWRLVSTPTQNTNFNDLFTDFWTQGATGSDAASAGPNLYNWQEPGSGSFSAVTDLNTNLTPGKGYIVYVYEDDDFRTPGVQGGFPKKVHTSEKENSSPVSVAVTSNDAGGASGIDGNEGYNLLGNPYGTDISVAEVIDALQAAAPSATVNANISVWDPDAGGGNGAFINLTDGDQLSPFQAFFMRYSTDGVSANVSFDRSNLAANKGKDFYKQPKASEVEFEMLLANSDKFDSYKVKFNEEGTVGEDRYDAYKLFSLNPHSIGLYSTIGDHVKLAKNVLPDLESLEGELRIPLGFELPESGRYTFSWNNLKDLPDEMELYLIDNETNRKVDLRLSEKLSFNSVISDAKSEASKSNLSPKITSTNTEDSPRFELLIIASNNTAGANRELEKMVEVSPNYPNPFRSQTTMDLKLKEKMHVKMTIWNIVGQKIATICDEMMQKGEHPMTWNITANMPSGIYICKVEAGGKVLTRKMTLVK